MSRATRSASAYLASERRRAARMPVIRAKLHRIRDAQEVSEDIARLVSYVRAARKVMQ